MRESENIRKMVYAGSFYPEHTSDLTREMDRLFDEASRLGEVHTAKPKALIVPHAGYMYSGLVAAKAYREVENREYDGIILLGPFHYRPGKGRYFKGSAPAVYSQMETPLGPIPYDKETSTKLADMLGTKGYETEESLEHSLEVQLPFIARTLPGVPVTTVLFGDFDLEDTTHLADCLKKVVAGGDYLILASTDLSHFYPYNRAVELDGRSLSFIENEDAQGLFSWNSETGGMLCGANGVLALMQTARKLNWHPELLIYQNSGDRGAGKDEVVGYASVAYYEGGVH